jgi:uracil-DNA glycosylase
MFLNKKPTLDEKGAFWHSVAFYNYVQYSAGDGPRIDPGVEKFKRSEPAFFEILNLLKPQLVITLGDRLWRRLPEEGCEGGVTLAGAETIEACRYRYGTDSCLAMKVRHPSSGFNGRTWNSCITEAIKIA